MKTTRACIAYDTATKRYVSRIKEVDKDMDYDRVLESHYFDTYDDAWDFMAAFNAEQREKETSK